MSLLSRLGLCGSPYWLPLLLSSTILLFFSLSLFFRLFVCFFSSSFVLSLSFFFKFLFEVSVVRSLSSFFFSLRPSHYLLLMVRLIAFTGIGIISNNELISLRIEKIEGILENSVHHYFSAVVPGHYLVPF